ncbi:MAG: hypothetical protein KAR39_07090 [Thermoplasmata archaeon]|nr:hypothetical protein [Thermoplasmata archaeon]
MEVETNAGMGIQMPPDGEHEGVVFWEATRFLQDGMALMLKRALWVEV